MPDLCLWPFRSEGIRPDPARTSVRCLARILLCLFLVGAAFGYGRADTEAPKPAGILILKAIAGYEAGAVSFVSIQWVDRNGGCVTDTAGGKTSFLNDAIGRIIYFDQTYYEEVDHNQYWVDWRTGVQSREIVLPPADSISLRPEALPRLHSEEAALEDIVERYPSGQSLVAPIIASLKDESANLSNGLVLQNGKWIPAKDAEATDVVPVIGDANTPITFTTKDGKRYENVRVTVTEPVIITPNWAGLSVVTP